MGYNLLFLFYKLITDSSLLISYLILIILLRILINTGNVSIIGVV